MVTRAMVWILRIYKLTVSPYLPSTCIYQPTCSDYAAEAISAYGAVRGSWMGIKRIIRCNPFVTGGIDVVPEPTEAGTRR